MKESEQHLRIIYSKVKVGCFLPRLREVCRKWEEKGGKTGLIDQKANARLERVRRRNVGKTGSVDQKANARWERVRLQVLAQRRLFARQGAVVAGWRTYRNRRLGPYLRLAYREGGRQRSIYLGRCEELAGRVRELLARLQRGYRERRLLARLKAQVRTSLRRWKAGLERLLAARGVQLKGFEFRGTRRALMDGGGAGTVTRPWIPQKRGTTPPATSKLDPPQIAERPTGSQILASAPVGSRAKMSVQVVASRETLGRLGFVEKAKVKGDR